MEPKVYLVIVDPQNDFIEGGALAVSGAQKAMDELAQLLNEVPTLFSKIFVTQDSHPIDHCSFIENGGTWPRHCVENTFGAEIYPPLKAALDKAFNVEYCKKGEDKEHDQYSIFDFQDSEIKNKYGKKMCEEITNRTNFIVFLTGIAGDVCVLNTLKDFLNFVNNDQIFVYRNFTASLDGGKKLDSFCHENSVKMFNFEIIQ